MSKRTERRQRRAARQRQQIYWAVGAVVAVVLIVVAILLLTQPSGGGASGDYLETASGLQYRFIEEGDGPTAGPGDTIVVHYRGRLENGTEFDNSYDRGQPFPVTIGQTSVIEGWTEGLQLLPQGSTAELVIPPDLAYGPSSPSPDIPPNATLIFEIEVLEVIPAAAE